MASTLTLVTELRWFCGWCLPCSLPAVLCWPLSKLGPFNSHPWLSTCVSSNSCFPLFPWLRPVLLCRIWTLGQRQQNSRRDYRRALKGIITAGTCNILNLSSTFKSCTPFSSSERAALLLLLCLEHISVELPGLEVFGSCRSHEMALCFCFSLVLGVCVAYVCGCSAFVVWFCFEHIWTRMNFWLR